MRPAAIALAVLALGSPAPAQEGAAVYDSGAGVQAHLGRPDGPVLPPARVTCAGCHGPDGQGGVEGGALSAPPVTWAHLAEPTPDRPAYDEAALTRLLQRGITPSGREISARMPRFSGSAPAFAALSRHLRDLDAIERRGLSPDSVAVALPRDAPARAAALAAIQSFNDEGGAFGRRVVEAEPAFLDLDRAVPELIARLGAAEQARLEQLLQTEPELHRIDAADPQSAQMAVAGTLDQIGPQLPALLARPGVQAVAVGPASGALLWALQHDQDAGAARAYAATRIALELLRDEGRMPTRSGLARRLQAADLSARVEVYRPAAAQ